jgi:hypothetical protein
VWVDRLMGSHLWVCFYLIPYLPTLSITGSRAGGFNIAPLASEVPRYTYWSSYPPHHTLFTVTHFFSQKIRGIQFDPRVLMFSKYPLNTLFRIPSPSTLYVKFRKIMDNIQCICLFSPSDVHLHMLASENVGLVTWP